MNASPVYRNRALAVAALCMAMVQAFPAGAAEPKPAVGVAVDADQLFDQGVAAQKAGKLAEAETLFLKAWALKKTWDIAANLGLVELKQGKLADGAGHVAYAIANLPPTESDSTRESLTKALAAARPSLGEVKVNCAVEGASVRVGGKLAGTTPLSASVFAEPGSLAIEVTKDGYAPTSKTVEVKKGATEQVMLTLTKQGTGGGDPRKEIVIAGAAVGGAVLVAGGILFGVGVSQRDALRGDAPKNAQGTAACADAQPASGATSACDDLRSRGRAANAMGQAGVGLLIGGGAVGAATVIYALWPRTVRAAEVGRVVPVVGPSGAGFLWTGSF